MKHTEGNELIAKFMGIEEQDMGFRHPKDVLPGEYPNDCPNSKDEDCWELYLHDLKYNTSWGWLMVVVTHISKLASLNDTHNSWYYSISSIGTSESHPSDGGVKTTPLRSTVSASLYI